MSDMRRMMMMFTRPVEVEPVLPYDAQVEYLQDRFEQGYTYLIDTGIYGTKNLKVEIKIQLLTVGASFGVFGHYGSGNQSYYLYQSAGQKWQTGMGANENATVSCDTNEHIFVYDNFVITMDGNVLNTISSSTFTTPLTLTLFNMRNNSGSTYNTRNKRLFYCKMWESGVLVRDFIPVRVSTTGYLYDRVSGELFANEKNGNFVLGNDVT